MSAGAAVLPITTPRPWVPPKLTEHADLVVMARALATAFGSIAALQGIGQSCTISPPSCS
jgi:hypothetical protein